MKVLRCFAVSAFAVLLLGACAPKMAAPFIPVIPQDLSSKVAGGAYEARVDNFLLIVDVSSSMARPYAVGSRHEVAQGLATGLNETLPELGWSGGLRIFGPHFKDPRERTRLIYAKSPHSRTEMAAALMAMPAPQGTSPLATAMRRAGDDLINFPGRTALIIFSDGEVESATEVLDAAAELYGRFPGNLCVYPVFVGDSKAGLTLLEGVVGKFSCGFVTRATDILSSEALTAYATKVFLQKAPPAKAPPVVVEPVAVKPEVKQEPVFRTETRNLKINFAFDCAKVRPGEHKALAYFAEFVKRHPEISSIEIGGHTCNMGPAAYNQRLSQRRAESVLDYLVTNFGLAKEKITAKGYGLTKPVADNATLQGRQQNRRVEAVVSIQVKVKP